MKKSKIVKIMLLAVIGVLVISAVAYAAVYWGDEVVHTITSTHKVYLQAATENNSKVMTGHGKFRVATPGDPMSSGMILELYKGNTLVGYNYKDFGRVFSGTLATPFYYQNDPYSYFICAMLGYNTDGTPIIAVSPIVSTFSSAADSKVDSMDMYTTIQKRYEMEPDCIIKALATNGETGYAYRSAFSKAYDGYTSEETDYMQANNIDEFVYVPLYDEAMENVIGEFEINLGGGSSAYMDIDGKVFVDGVYKETIAPENMDSIDLIQYLDFE